MLLAPWRVLVPLQLGVAPLKNHAEGVDIINAKHCISPTRSVVYHQAAGLVYHHRAKRGAYHLPYGLYLITRQRVYSLRLDEIQHCVLVIYNASH